MSADKPRIDPLFDGHAERPLAELSFSEKLDWIWAAMELLNHGRAAREAQRKRARED